MKLECVSQLLCPIERPALLSSPESSVEECTLRLVMRPLEIVCNANRDLFLGDFRGRLDTFCILNILDLSFEHLWRMVTSFFPFCFL